ncbi:MAG: hypothetical protein R8K20_02070 [Gallionellaceae bacterium]
MSIIADYLATNGMPASSALTVSRAAYPISPLLLVLNGKHNNVAEKTLYYTRPWMQSANDFLYRVAT